MRWLFDAEEPVRGQRWLLAFSGGPDSTALAALFKAPASEREVELDLVHVDHRLDPESPARAEAARALAGHLGLRFESRVADMQSLRRRDESPEAAARRVRYGALEEARRERGATRILTAHHRDDQIETVLLQLLRGAPIERLGGIPARRGPIWRPLLDVARSDLLAALAALGIEAIDDATNRDLAVPRNRVRHLLLPRLRAASPGIDESLLALAARSASVRSRLDSLIRSQYEKTRETSIEGKNEGKNGNGALARPLPLPTRFLTGLPEPLRSTALRWLLEQEGVVRLPSFPSMKAFLSLASGIKLAALDVPLEARRLVARRGELAWETPKSRTPPFSYTFSMPGEVELPELGLRLRIRRAPVEPWMFQGDRARVGFESEAERATVRSRTPGERMRPLGAPGSRKLKAILIDRGIPAPDRDRLPLLVIEGELAWVPGVALGERFALRGVSNCWRAELEALPGTSGASRSGERTES